MNRFNKFRGIFERFRNLNLLCLIEDLKHDNVAFAAWLFKPSGEKLLMLCPIAHGIKDCECLKNDEFEWFDKLLRISLSVGANSDDVYAFVREWDKVGFMYRISELLLVLEPIWRERLADALAVTEVLEQVEGSVIEEECLCPA